MTPRSKAVLSWAFVVLWACLVFLMSANAGSGLSSGEGLASAVFCALRDAQAALLGPDADVVSPCAHLCEYAVLGALLANALRHRLPVRKAPVAALVCGSLYGAADELRQLFVPGRMCGPADWAVDAAGALLGAWLACAAITRLRRPGRLGR